MFDFEKLDVYQHVKELNNKVLRHASGDVSMDDHIRDIWKKASLNIMLQLVAGTGRVSNLEKKQFLTLSRGAVFEAVALMDVAYQCGQIDELTRQELYDDYEKASKMLLGMFRSYDKRNGDGEEF